MDGLAKQMFAVCSDMLALGAVSDEMHDSYILKNSMLVIEVLEEIIATNGNPSDSKIKDIQSRGRELTIDNAMKMDAFFGMTRAEVEQTLKNGYEEYLKSIKGEKNVPV